jgi:ribonuclease P/MRP protein subunit RPP40
MSLLDLISGDFFNVYIKTGNVLMVSEGRPHIDNCFTLSQGMLRLDLDNATYERCGLVGKSIAGSGRKHAAPRFGVFIPEYASLIWPIA